MKDRIKAIRESLRTDKGKKYTQAEFADKLNVSKSTIEAVEYGRRDATDRMIADIVREFNVNEDWLRTGSGDMFKEKTRHDQITDFLADVLNDEPDSFRLGFVNALAELSVDEWQMLANICEKFLRNKNSDAD